MSTADLYALVVDLHLCADIVFVGGLLASALVVTALTFTPADKLARERGIAVGMHRWDRRVTAPALGLAWLLGAWLAWRGHWYVMGWLQAKFALVVVLSGLHGVLAGALRRLAADPPVPPRRVLRVAAPLVAVCAAAIVWLVLLKPF
jgi:protoporphyrinogen IX oxidase